MKTYFIILFSLLVGAFAAPTAQADNYNDGWTFYGSSNYRGSKKMMNAGEYNNCSNWRYYSWKAERNCCIIFYYYKKNGQKGERKVCGDIRDFKSEMRKWGSLKHGWNLPWKNIYKAVFVCGGGGDSHANNNNNNNNKNNNNTGGGDWRAHFNQGKCVVWRGDNYRDDFYYYSPGKKYYPRDLKWKFWSLRIPQGYEFYCYVRQRNGQKKGFILKGEVMRLRDQFGKWNLQDRNRGWDAVDHFIIRKAGSGGGGNQQANNGNNSNNTGGGGDWRSHYNQGKCVVWKGDNYRDDYYYYSVNKKYYPKDLKWKFWSLRIPQGYEFYCYVRQRNGQKKGFILKGEVMRLRDQFGKWNLQDRNRGWDAVDHFIIRKAGSGGGGNQQANNGNNSNNTGGGGDWRSHYNQGKCVVWKGDNYRDDYYYYSVNKKYYPKDLKWKFWSLRIPQGYEFYCYVRQRNGQKKGFILKGEVMRLRDQFGKWNLQDRNRGWDAVDHFIIRKTGSGGGNNNGHNNNNKDYTHKEWYQKYGRGGYITFFQYKNFDGRYYGKPAGDYDPRRLVYPQSCYMKGTSKYLVLEYYDKRNRKKSVVIKESIHDLGRYLYDLGVHDKYKGAPYKAITRLAVMNQ